MRLSPLGDARIGSFNPETHIEEGLMRGPVQWAPSLATQPDPGSFNSKMTVTVHPMATCFILSVHRADEFGILSLGPSAKPKHFSGASGADTLRTGRAPVHYRTSFTRGF